MTKCKRVLSLLLCCIMTFALLGGTVLTASAASVSSSLGYDQPENSGDYAYWSGSKVVKSSSTTKNEVKWMQVALNYCISKEGLSATKLTVDGSFGPASKNATIKFQKATGLTADGSFGPSAIKKMKAVLNDGKATFKTTTLTTTEGSWLWPTSLRRLSCGFADNYYHTSHWHRGVDIPTSLDSDVYASKSGTVALVVGDTSSRGKYVVIDHGDGYYSEYQHLKSISVKQGDAVKQGQVIAKTGATNGTKNGGAAHLHFEIMYLGKAGLGSKYTSYWNSYSYYVNTNPANSDKVYCTKSNSSFVIRQQQGNGIKTANLVKTNNVAAYGVYCYDTNGIYYTFK